MKEMAAGKFKAQCLAVMDQVLQSGEPVLITKHGKPVAKLVPAEKQADDIFGYMAGKVKIVGDIVRPVTPLKDWECKWLRNLSYDGRESLTFNGVPGNLI